MSAVLSEVAKAARERAIKTVCARLIGAPEWARIIQLMRAERGSDQPDMTGLLDMILAEIKRYLVSQAASIQRQ